jgi:hypothetical protein
MRSAERGGTTSPGDSKARVTELIMSRGSTTMRQVVEFVRTEGLGFGPGITVIDVVLCLSDLGKVGLYPAENTTRIVPFIGVGSEP